MEKPHFKGWNNIEEGYYTKTTLQNEYGLKPKSAEPDATVIATNHKGEIRSLRYITLTIH